MRFISASTLALVALTTYASAEEVWTTIYEDVVVTEIATQTVWVSELPESTPATSTTSAAAAFSPVEKAPAAYTSSAAATTTSTSSAISTSTSSTYAFQPSTFVTYVSSSVASSTTVAPVASSTSVQTSSSAASSSTIAPVASSTSSAPAAYSSSSSSSSSGTTISVTPHDSYSSSVGVLGCKINTNRVAYWPTSVGCDNLCVKVSYQGRSLTLLRVDQSGGAHDISYDAWNTLYTGSGAAQDPQMGGGVDMTYENVDMSECADLLLNTNGKLGLEASNSMNYVASCISEPSSWVAQNYALYNIADAVCTLGYDEECSLDLATSNQPSCPHQLGVQTPLTTCPVYNLAYGTGKSTLAV